MYMVVMCTETEIIQTDCYGSLSQRAIDIWKETPALQAAGHLLRWAQAHTDTAYCIAKSSVNSYEVFLAS